MSSDDPDLAALVGDLTTVVEELQTELESRGPPRPPTPRRLTEFTTEVTIPAIILVLETNVRALRLLQRTLRYADGRDGAGEDSATRKRASDLGRATLSRLDDALSDLGSALDDRPADNDARDLLEEVRDLQAELDARLDTESEPAATGETRDSVGIDVDAELESIKDDVEDDSHGGRKDNN
jgi:hypothetical protein